MNQLGNLEEMILLLVLITADDESYGVSIAEEYRKKTGKSISVPAVHTVLKRLEKKGMVNSEMGEATRVRGGKRKRIYSVTKFGYKVLKEIQDNRSELWNLAPKGI